MWTQQHSWARRKQIGQGEQFEQMKWGRGQQLRPTYLSMGETAERQSSHGIARLAHHAHQPGV
jgi:hypothetical protein